MPKYLQFITDTPHPMICPNPDDSTINKFKDQQQSTAKKRSTQLKTMNAFKCIIYDQNKKCINDVGDEIDEIDDLDDLDNKDNDASKKIILISSINVVGIMKEHIFVR